MEHRSNKNNSTPLYNRMCMNPFSGFLYVFLAFSLFWPFLAQADTPHPSPSNPHQVYPSDDSLPEGIIGVAVHLSAHRVGDPARLYVRAIHPEGPAAKVGLAHGDEILSVDGTALVGKTYEQVVRLIRGAVGEKVTLQVNGVKGKHELVILRDSEQTLMKQKGT